MAARVELVVPAGVALVWAGFVVALAGFVAALAGFVAALAALAVGWPAAETVGIVETDGFAVARPGGAHSASANTAQHLANWVSALNLIRPTTHAEWPSIQVSLLEPALPAVLPAIAAGAAVDLAVGFAVGFAADLAAESVELPAADWLRVLVARSKTEHSRTPDLTGQRHLQFRHVCLCLRLPSKSHIARLEYRIRIPVKPIFGLHLPYSLPFLFFPIFWLPITVLQRQLQTWHHRYYQTSLCDSDGLSVAV